MAEIAGSVLVSLGLDVDEFNTGLQQAQKLAANAGKSISDKLDARRATLSALQQQLTQLETKLKSNPWSAAALEAPIKALKAEIELRKQSIALLEKQVQVSKTAATTSKSNAAANFIGGAAEALPGIGGALAKFGPAAGAAAAGAGIAAAGAAAVKTSNDFQKLNQQLTLLTGSATVTDKALAELKAYAAATPFDLPGVAENTKLLLAFGLSTEQAVEFTKRLGDVATITGTPLDRLALNLGQIVSLGKAYTVDLRQFAIAGVPIFEALSQATGKTVAELKQLDSIPAADVVKAFKIMTDAGGKFFEGGIKGGTQLDTKIASLGDSLKEVGAVIGREITPVAVGFLKSAIDAVDNLKEAINLLNELKSKLPGGNSPNAAGVRAASSVFTTPGFSLLKAGLNNLKYELSLFANQSELPSAREANADVRLRTLEKIRAAESQTAKEALQAAKMRAEADKNIVEPAQRRLRLLEETINLSGADLQIASQRAEVEEAIRLETEAAAALSKARSESGGKQNDEATIQAAARLQVAGIAIQEARLKYSKTIQDDAANTALFLGNFKLQAQALEDRITKAKELAGIEDQAQRAQVAAAQSVLDSIAQARQKQAELGLQLQNQVAKGGSTEDIRSTIAQLSAAGGELELALVNGGRALKDQLNEATKRLDDTLSSNFAILTQIGKQRVLEQAQSNITRGVQTGLVDPTLIPSQTNAQAFIAFGQQAAAIADSVANFNTTQRSVTDAQAKLATDFASTGTLVTKSIGNLADSAIPNLVAALNRNATADRTISVTVNADTGQTFINQAAALP